MIRNYFKIATPRVLLSILFLWGMGICNAQSQNKTVAYNSIKRSVDKIVKAGMDEQHIAGLSLAVIKDGKVLIAIGYGLSNIEQNIPASDKTVYKLGSVSKQMIATVIMKFVQEGKLSLTDSLPKFFLGAPATWNKITVRNLLNHTSGLPRDSPLLDNMKEQSDSLLIKAAYKSPLLFEPGSKWRYCNLGYFMLADIIRQLSHQSFTDFMQYEIFEKYGLFNTRTTSQKAIIKNRAAGYVYENGKFYNSKDYVALRPSGAFVSSVSDLIKWEMIIQNNQILTHQNWQKMWSDKVKTSDATPIEYYGYGWDLNEYKNHKAIHHDGTIPGFTSSYFRFPDDKLTIIVLTNADNAFPKNIALSIADILLNAF